MSLNTAMKPNERYEPVIGLEVHAQLLTRSKAFCGCTTQFGNRPNANVCPVCLGMPGVLPVLNRNVVDSVLKMGLATYCTIASRSVFARKNYFYPDLPKGYQISQYDEPICEGGYIEIDLDDGVRKRIGIARIHIEEDAGKSIHDLGADTLVDFNRCGVPLMEVVSKPELHSPVEAHLFLSKIRQIVTYLGICSGIMEEGSLRCDANISLRRKGVSAFGEKTELKNLNSFRNVERALKFESDRQIQLLEKGEKVVQETLLWDADHNVAVPMRTKEKAHDYRYFTEPDLVPVVVDEAWIESVKAALPEHPTARRDRFIADYALPTYDADLLTSEKGYADYFESALATLGESKKSYAKAVSNWVMTAVLGVIGERNITIDAFPVGPERLARMVLLIGEGVISGKIAKEVFEEMLSSVDDPQFIVEKKGLAQLSDKSAIEKVVDEVIGNNGPQVSKYRAGNEKVFGFLVGEVMKATQGKANPVVVNMLLKGKLSVR